jgi:hypothetical protein
VPSLDLHEYHELLHALKQHHAAHPNEALSEEEIPEYFEWQFFDADPPDNVFARFSYVCLRHPYDPAPHGTWFLLWDPTLPNCPRSSLHASCAPEAFNWASDRIQKSLVQAFPLFFTQRWSDGITGYEFDP